MVPREMLHDVAFSLEMQASQRVSTTHIIVVNQVLTNVGTDFPVDQSDIENLVQQQEIIVQISRLPSSRF